MILIAFGTRPEYIKLKPIIDKLDDCIVLNTMQQKNLCSGIEADYYFSDYELVSNRLDQILINQLKNCDTLDWDRIDSVIVQGDTATAFAISLAAFHRQKKIYHVEAGLRTYDLQNPYPEEFYRQTITKIADVHFCPTFHDYHIVKKECKKNSDAIVTGNTVLDNIEKNKILYGNEIIITLHRRENHQNIDSWLSCINRLAEKNSNLKFTWIVHPNPLISSKQQNYKFLNCINPLSRESIIDLLAKCKMLITDSGGLQEEASFLNKRTLVCRKTTERPCSSSILIESPEALDFLFDKYKDEGPINLDCPFGDGKASDRICEYVQTHI